MSKKQVTLVSAKFGAKLADNGLVLPVVGQVQLDSLGQVSVDADKVDELIEATKDSIVLVPVESKQAAQGEAVSELEQALRDADTKTLLELVKEANLNIDPKKLAGMSNDKLIKLLVKQAQELQVAEQTRQEDDKKEEEQGPEGDAQLGAGDDYPVEKE